MASSGNLSPKPFLFITLQSLGVIVLLLIGCPQARGVQIDAASFQLPPEPILAGSLAVNNLLQEAERLHGGQIGVPHSYAILEDDVYAVTQGGLVVNVVPCRPVVIANLRPRGCRVSRHLFDSDTPVNGRASRYLNDFVYVKDGTIVLSDPSPTFDYAMEFWIRFEGRADGRLLGFNPVTGQVREIMAGIAYPTGLDITNDQQALLVSEAGRARILRVEVKKGKFFQRTLFNTNLPGMPEHIRQTEHGTYWVGLTYPRHQGEMSVMDQYSNRAASRNFLASRRTKDQLKLMYTQKGLAVELNNNGRIVRSMHDPSGLKVKEVLELTEYKGIVYVGTREQGAVVLVVKPPTELTVDSVVHVMRGRCQVTEDKIEAAKAALHRKVRQRQAVRALQEKTARHSSLPSNLPAGLQDVPQNVPPPNSVSPLQSQTNLTSTQQTVRSIQEKSAQNSFVPSNFPTGLRDARQNVPRPNSDNPTQSQASSTYPAQIRTNSRSTYQQQTLPVNQMRSETLLPQTSQGPQRSTTMKNIRKSLSQLKKVLTNVKAPEQNVQNDQSRQPPPQNGQWDQGSPNYGSPQNYHQQPMPVNPGYPPTSYRQQSLYAPPNNPTPQYPTQPMPPNPGYTQGAYVPPGFPVPGTAPAPNQGYQYQAGPPQQQYGGQLPPPPPGYQYMNNPNNPSMTPNGPFPGSYNGPVAPPPLRPSPPVEELTPLKPTIHNSGSPTQTHVVHGLHNGQLVSHIMVGKEALTPPQQEQTTEPTPVQAPTQNNPKPKLDAVSEYLPSDSQLRSQILEALNQESQHTSGPSPQEIVPAAKTPANEPSSISQTMPSSAQQKQNFQTGSLGGFADFMQGPNIQSGSTIGLNDKAGVPAQSVEVPLPDQGPVGLIENGAHIGGPNLYRESMTNTGPQGNKPTVSSGASINVSPGLDQFIGSANAPPSGGEVHMTKPGELTNTARGGKDHFFNTFMGEAQNPLATKRLDNSQTEGLSVQNTPVFHPSDGLDSLTSTQNQAVSKSPPNFGQNRMTLLKQGLSSLQQLMNINEQNAVPTDNANTNPNTNQPFDHNSPGHVLPNVNQNMAVNQQPGGLGVTDAPTGSMDITTTDGHYLVNSQSVARHTYPVTDQNLTGGQTSFSGAAQIHPNQPRNDVLNQHLEFGKDAGPSVPQGMPRLPGRESQIPQNGVNPTASPNGQSLLTNRPAKHSQDTHISPTRFTQDCLTSIRTSDCSGGNNTSY